MRYVSRNISAFIYLFTSTNIVTDIGVTKVGNHGGSSQGEVSTVFVFMSSLFEEATPAVTESGTMLKDGEFIFPVVDQVDLIPTLSFLFGLPVPKNNLGKVILDLLVGQKGMICWTFALDTS